jgi:hypothetical protein
LDNLSDISNGDELNEVFSDEENHNDDGGDNKKMKKSNKLKNVKV